MMICLGQSLNVFCAWFKMKNNCEISVSDWSILMACQPVNGYFMPRG